MARKPSRRKKSKGESWVALVQWTADTANIEKIKLEANERNAKEEFESARASRLMTSRHDWEEICIVQRSWSAIITRVVLAGIVGGIFTTLCSSYFRRRISISQDTKWSAKPNGRARVHRHSNHESNSYRRDKYRERKEERKKEKKQHWTINQSFVIKKRKKKPCFQSTNNARGAALEDWIGPLSLPSPLSRCTLWQMCFMVNINFVFLPIRWCPLFSLPRKKRTKGERAKEEEWISIDMREREGRERKSVRERANDKTVCDLT